MLSIKTLRVEAMNFEPIWMIGELLEAITIFMIYNFTGGAAGEKYFSPRPSGYTYR